MHGILYDDLLCIGEGECLTGEDAAIETNRRVVTDAKGNVDDSGIATEGRCPVLYSLKQEEEGLTHQFQGVNAPKS